MKKIILHSLLILSSTVINIACLDVKDYEDGRISYEEIFQNDKKTAAYLNLCYSCIESFGMQYGGNTLLAGFSDEAQDANDVLSGNAYSWHNGRLTPYSNPINNGWWENYWSGIRYCNIFLANIDQAKIALESNRNSWKAQAHALRAFYYLQLIKRFGGVPITTQPYPEKFDYSQIKKTSFSECAKLIFADCDEALKASDAELGWRAGNADSDRGKFTKAVVHAIKSQTALYAASPLWNDGTITWTDAATITMTALNECLSHGYDLYKQQPGGAEGYSAYDVYFYTRSDVNGASDKETIYESREQMSIYKYCGLPINNGVEKAGVCPSQELVDAYETIDGVSPILGYSDNNHLQPIINPNATLYHADRPYENRDPRMKASIYYNGALYNLADPNSKVWTYKGGNCEISQTNIIYTRTGYYIRKFSHYGSNKNSNKDGYFKVFRLAELYLNAAEALNEASTTGKAPDKAVQAINAVRQRVNMPSIDSNISCDEFRLKVRNERRVELAFEEHRFYDVRRWKILAQTDKTVTGMSCTNSNGKFTYKRYSVDNNRNAWTDKFLIFPIPGDEAIRLKDYTGISFQNPGWE